MTVRRALIELLSHDARSVSSIAREMGLHRADAEEDLRHALRSAAAAGHRVEVIPARCRSCGFVFAEDPLTKPSRCPSCKCSRLFEPQIRTRRRRVNLAAVQRLYLSRCTRSFSF